RRLTRAVERSSDPDSKPADSESQATKPADSENLATGLDPALFGKHPNGSAIDPASLCVQAPSVIAFQLPADLVAGCELVATGVLEQDAGAEGSVQLQLLAGKPARELGLVPSELTVTVANGQWTADNRQIAYATPILVNETSATRERIESAFDEFRRLFP